MFSMNRVSINPTHYRKKLETDKDDERTGDYIFRFTQPTIVDVQLSFDQLEPSKKQDCIAKLLLAQEEGRQAEIVGIQTTKNYKSGAMHIFTVSDVIYNSPNLKPKGVANVQ